jgi:hypothetical protein
MIWMMEQIEKLAEEMDDFLKGIFDFGQSMRAIESTIRPGDRGALTNHKIRTSNELSRVLQALPLLQSKFSRLPAELFPQDRQISEAIRRSLARIYIECSNRKNLSDEWVQLRAGEYHPTHLDQIKMLEENIQICENSIHVEANKLLKIAFKLRKQEATE